MDPYPKIKSIFKRSQESGRTLFGEYATPEFRYLANMDTEWTGEEKIDGTNIRVKYFHDTKTVSFHGRTDNAQMYDPLLDRLFILFNSAASLTSLNDMFPDTDACLYGEGFGPGIQSGGYYLDYNDFMLFDVRVGKWWLQRADVTAVGKRLNLRLARPVSPMPIAGLINYVENMPTNKFIMGVDPYIPEGIVIRPAVEMLDRNGDRIIAKIKVHDFVYID